MSFGGAIYDTRARLANVRVGTYGWYYIHRWRKVVSFWGYARPANARISIAKIFFGRFSPEAPRFRHLL